MAESEEIIESFPTRDEGIASAVSEGSAEAIQTGETTTIHACIGPPCPPGTKADNCPMCEIIVCLPDGTVQRGARAS